MEANGARRHEAADDGPPVGEAAKVLEFDRRRRDEVAEAVGPVITESEAQRRDERYSQMSARVAIQASREGMGT